MRMWMRRVIWLVLFIPLAGSGQSSPEKACRVEEGRLVFTLDTRWNTRQRDQLVRMFDLDSALVARAMKGEASLTARGVKWDLKKLDANRYELSKPLASVETGKSGQVDVTLLDDRWMTDVGIRERESAVYGMNMITRADVFSYRNGIAHFYLPGRQEANEVYLAGSFNAFSTTRAPMTRTDSGWIAAIRLKPGKYLYKYVIDGRWTPDPHNRLREDDTYGDYNSVIYCYNYIFYLRGFNNAGKVTVAGSFNEWNESELHLQHVSGGWIRAMYLREGTHSYKFLVDGHWVLDPANKTVRTDGAGNMNNFISIGDTMHFRLKGFTTAKQIIVAGNFNNWNQRELPMDKVEGGWDLPYVLKAGNYEYKFIADGKWMTDPGNPYSTGSGDYRNSFVTVKPNVMFSLEGHSDARKVIVTGSFNNWNPQEYEMSLKNGKWIFPIHLQPGKYRYKFIVDGKWILDPANTLWEQNEYGTGNSVMWVEE